MSGGRFDVCVDTVLKYEVGPYWSSGGYTNDPLDPGGETKWGISKRAHPTVDIKNLTLEQAKAIYFREYWTAASCFVFPAPFDMLVFDAAVNGGVVPAIRQAQRALGLRDDGVVGQQTISRAGLPTTQSKSMIAKFLVERCEALRVAPAAPRFFKGWMARVFSLHELSLEVAA